MCKVFEVSSSGFYHWLSAPQTARGQRKLELLDKIRSIHKSSHGTYGSPRVTAELNKRGCQISRSYVARLMKEEGIRSKIKRKYRITTDSDHTYPVADRKVVGWAFSKDMTAENTTIAALKMAIKNRGVKQGLIFHSDRGIQYACNDFRSLLEEYRILSSMSRKGNCWDNAVAESFFKTLKCELVYHRRFANREIARLEIFRYIETYYNSQRSHSALGYLTPNEMEKLLINLHLIAA